MLSNALPMLRIASAKSGLGSTVERETNLLPLSASATAKAANCHHDISTSNQLSLSLPVPRKDGQDVAVETHSSEPFPKY